MNLITSAEREEKDSRRSGMYQSWLFFLTRLGTQSLQVVGFVRPFDEVKAELVLVCRDHFDFFDLLFNFFEEQRIIRDL